MALYKVTDKKETLEPLYIEAPTHKQAESEFLMTLKVHNNDYGTHRSDLRETFKLQRVSFLPWRDK